MPTKTSSVSASSLPRLAKRPAPQGLSIGGFEEHNENRHGVDFEAPFSTESQKPPLTKGRFSIDLSIELERQLETMEASPPSSPPAAAAVSTYGDVSAIISVGGDDSNTEAQSYDHDASNDHVDKELLDPEILAHIITQLRHSLSEITKERDDLVKMLAGVNAEEANVKDALQLMTEKATQVDEELGEAKKKMKEDEEQIALLRAKVDESRRGLMRLQSESRRQSVAPIDITRAASLSVANFGNPPSAKRASFTPLTGSRHGRMPSPDNNLVAPDHTPASSPPGSSGVSPNPPLSSRRFSGLFGRVSPGIPDNEADVQPPHAEMETLKAEVKSLKTDLESVRHELVEATEAKEASETCVKALREFIAENNIGAMRVNLPSPPTMASVAQDTTTAEPKKVGSGWGFKLWGSGPGGPSANSGPAMINCGVVDPQGAVIPPPMSAAPSSGTYGVPPTPVTAVPIPTPAAPAALSRKLTGLFSSRSSVSSKGSQAKSQLGSNTGASGLPLIDRTNSVYSHSDVSSVVEPMSPVMVNGDSGLGVGVVKPLDEDRVARESVTNLDLLAGGIEKGQETPSMSSLYEVDLNNGLR